MERKGRWAVIGGVMLCLSAAAPWLGDARSSEWGFGVPAALAVNLETAARQPAIGWVVLLLGIGILAASRARWAWPASQIAGGLATVIAVAIAVQIARFSAEVGAGFLSLLNPLGLGFYLALAGGLLALLAPISGADSIEDRVIAVMETPPLAAVGSAPPEESGARALVPDDGLETEAEAVDTPSTGESEDAEA